MYLFIILFLALCIFGVRYTKCYSDKPLSMDVVIPLRGICAIEIMLGHIGITTGSPYLYINRKAGILIVGLFLLFSGYGLMQSVLTKENYLDNFIQKRVWKILQPAIVIYAITIIKELISNGFNNSLLSLLKHFTFISFPSKMNWYVTEIVALYLLFYLLFRSFKTKKATILLIAVCTLFVIVAYFLNMDNPWYGSTLCFPLGILFAQYQNHILNFFKRRYVLMIIMSFIAICLGTFCFFFLNNYSFWADVIGRSIASLSFSIFAILLLMKIKIGNRFSIALGKISYEIFLVHGLFIGYHYFSNDIINTLLTITLSISGAALLNKVVNKYTNIKNNGAHQLK